MTVPAPALECRRLTVSYGSRAVLSDLDLTVGPGEAVVLLGPSGCGKTTLLYTVAGFVPVQSGEVLLSGELVADTRGSRPPEERGVGVVFQNYALWPHLSALETVAYPLRREGMSKAEARAQGMVFLHRMGIAGLATRKPAQLSGGEQQRVGVARALARRAGLYLFDEPTAHLDTALRAVLQDELAAQRAVLGAAILYATHDVTEALAVADRVALLREGRVVQVAAPHEVYEQPVDMWAARLTGPAAVVVVQVVRVRSARSFDLEVAGHRIEVAAGTAGEARAGRALGLVRPEWARLGGPLPGRVVAVRYRGPETDYRLETPAGTVEVREPGVPRARVGDTPGWTLHRVWLLPAGTDPGPPPVAAQPVEDPVQALGPIRAPAPARSAPPARW